MTITVHVIFNAHLDPVWLWPWQAGLDEALATCRSACDRLDANPDIHFTRGEAWVYKQIEELDPALFARIRTHVVAGRWEVVGGWWIQPDCNLPDAFAFKQQIGLGLQYFRDRFGAAPRAAYNVDSFGHAAALPGLMRAAGQDRYVMMRPQQHEMNLPARLFRWRGREGEPEVTTFRISRGYCHRDLNADAVNAACSRLPEGIAHTMIFAGVGDHGGGPSEKLIAWCRANREAIPGCRLEFSTVKRFFDAVEAESAKLPLITGELQHHAIGCYTAHRAIKTGVKRAGHALAQAEAALAGRDDAGARQALRSAWEAVCFNQFHDTFGGTCIPSAYRQCEDQVAAAAAAGDSVTQRELRRRYPALGADPAQRIVALNASDTAYDGYAEFEPWLDWRPDTFALLDESGAQVPWQRLPMEATLLGGPRVLFRVKADPGAVRQFRLASAKQVDPAPGAFRVRDSIATAGGNACDGHRLTFGSALAAIEPLLDLYEDGTDTWSHGIDRYPEGPAVASASWANPTIIEAGPLMASCLAEGRIGASELKAEWRVYADEPFCELALRVHWMERRKLLKLRLSPPFPFLQSRVDGTMDTSVNRPNDGRELPLRDWSLLEMAGGLKLGIVSPDVFALDADKGRVRLTLLRSCVMAHHEPHRGHFPREVFSDQGVHLFRFRFFLSETVDPATLDRQARMMQRPLVLGDLTTGMPTHRQ